MRAEGQRTTWLIASPPNLRTEASPEHPAWHFASAARLASTGTRVPEQELKRLASLDKLDSLQSTMHDYNSRLAAKHESDWQFDLVDIASRVSRKREERGNYAAAITVRKNKAESGLSKPFPPSTVLV